MNIFSSSSFDHALKKIVRKKPEIKILLSTALVLLQADLRTPSLGVHKLKGNLEGRWAFSLTYSIRVTFIIKKSDLWLTNIGAHDDVY